MLLTGEPEASVEVTQHVLVLASFPDIVDGIGQLLPLYSGQLLFLQRRQRHVGRGVLGVRGGGLWTEEGVKRIEVQKRRERTFINKIYPSMNSTLQWRIIFMTNVPRNSDINPTTGLLWVTACNINQAWNTVLWVICAFSVLWKLNTTWKQIGLALEDKTAGYRVQITCSCRYKVLRLATKLGLCESLPVQCKNAGIWGARKTLWMSQNPGLSYYLLIFFWNIKSYSYITVHSLFSDRNTVSTQSYHINVIWQL